MFQHPEILRDLKDGYLRERVSEAEQARLLAAARHGRRHGAHRHGAHRHSSADGDRSTGTVVECGRHGAAPAR